MLIKAGSIQNLTDARYFTSQQAAWIGFCFDTSSPAFLHPREAQQIMNWLQGPNFIGEFGAQSVKEIQETAMIMNLAGVEIDAQYITDEHHKIQGSVALKVALTEAMDYGAVKALLQKHKGPTEYVLIDLNNTFANWTDFLSKSRLGIDGLNQLEEEYALMLAAPFDRENIEAITSSVDLFAVQFNGSSEHKTGEKAFDELEELFELLN